MKNNNDQKRITVNLDAEIYAQLERVAKEIGIQIITAVARQAIVYYLSQKATCTIKKGY
jgi:metal-responsive CopG/Arc/MetJ family transcriptional regulator